MQPPGARDLPKWFTPRRLLAIFCATNMMVYLDRGLVASNGVNGSPPSEADPTGSGIQGYFRLTYFQSGLLPAFFLIGLMVSSPVFAEACKYHNAFRLLGIGMGVWTAAVLAAGLAPTYGLLLLARAFVGVGEASFVALAAPFIDDYAPAGSKTRWLSLFYLCIPTGFAGGYIVGGIVATALSWRAALVLEGVAMIPFVAFCFLSKPIHLTGSGSGSMKNATAAGVMSPQRGVDQRVVDASTLVATPRSPASPSAAPPEAAPPAATLGLVAQRFCVDVAEVLRQPVFVSTCFGYTLYVAVLGAYAFWGPQAGKAIFFGVHDHSATPDLVFGGVTLLTGVLGSVIGGAALDRCGSTNRNASLLCAGCVLVGFVLAVSAFMATRSFAAFMVVFGAAQLFLFMVQAPIAGLSMWCVPRALRPLAVSCITIVIHVLGDVPSPPLLGALQARLSRGKSEQEAAQQWRTSLSVISLLLILSSAVFGYGSYIASNAQMEDNAKDSAPVSDTGEGEDGGGGGRSRRHDRSDNDVEGSVGGDDSVTPLLGAEVSSSSGDAAGLLASLQPSSQAAAISAGLPSDGSAYRSSGVGGGVLREVGGSLLGGSRGRV